MAQTKRAWKLRKFELFLEMKMHSDYLQSEGVCSDANFLTGLR